MEQSTKSRLASRMQLLRGEGAIETFAKAQKLELLGRKIIHLEIGEPDFATPDHIVDAGIEALRQGHTRYTPAPGITELRKAIAAEVTQSRGIPASLENVVVVPGAKFIVLLTLLALIEPGDEVILTDPGYPAYNSVIAFLGAKPIALPLYEELDFRFDEAELRAAVSPRTRMIIINSPQNPTGGVLNKYDLEVVAELANENDIWVLSDEIYHHIIYNNEFQSISSLPGMQDRTIILDGFSKSYSMTGWRLGYVICAEHIAEAITCLIINSSSCSADFSQRAGIAALTGPQDMVYSMAESFRRRRDLVVSGLNTIPNWKCKTPAGAFYAFPNIKASGLSSQQMADYLLDQADVALLPGNGFGANGEGYLRISYANSETNLQQAIQRITKAVRRL